MGFLEDIMGAISGKPAQSGLYFPDQVMPPFYNEMSKWGPTIGNLWNTPLPQYQGNIDPGMSPTMQNYMKLMQGNAMQGPNSAMQGAQGALGRYTQPGAGMMGQNDIMSARNKLMNYQNPRWQNAGAAAGGGQMTSYFPQQPQRPGMPSPRPMPGQPPSPWQGFGQPPGGGQISGGPQPWPGGQMPGGFGQPPQMGGGQNPYYSQGGLGGGLGGMSQGGGGDMQAQMQSMLQALQGGGGGDLQSRPMNTQAYGQLGGLGGMMASLFGQAGPLARKSAPSQQTAPPPPGMSGIDLMSTDTRGKGGTLNMGYQGNTWGQRYGAGSAGRGEGRNAGLGFYGHSTNPKEVQSILDKGIGHDILKPYGYQPGQKLTQQDIYDISATKPGQQVQNTPRFQLQKANWQDPSMADARTAGMASMDPEMQAAFKRQWGL